MHAELGEAVDEDVPRANGKGVDFAVDGDADDEGTIDEGLVDEGAADTVAIVDRDAADATVGADAVDGDAGAIAAS